MEAPQEIASATTAQATIESGQNKIEGLTAGIQNIDLNSPAGDPSELQGAAAAQAKGNVQSPPYEFTPAMERTLEKLRELQSTYDEHEAEYLKEWNALKLKYLQKFRPLYEKRCDIISAPAPSQEATEEQFPAASPSLPDFWLHAFKNHRVLAALIQEADEPVFRYLKDIKSAWLDDNEQTSFKLSFYFTPNPYFFHEVLHKTYNMERDEDGGGILLSTEGTKIEWNTDHDPTKVVVTKRQRNTKTRQTRVIKETRKQDSFFDFFNSFEFPTPEEFERLGHYEASRIEKDVEEDFDIGCVIREKIVPRALGWFMGEEDDELSDEESEDDSDEGDSDDEASSDEDDDEDVRSGQRA